MIRLVEIMSSKREAEAWGLVRKGRRLARAVLTLRSRHERLPPSKVDDLDEKPNGDESHDNTYWRAKEGQQWGGALSTCGRLPDIQNLMVRSLRNERGFTEMAIILSKKFNTKKKKQKTGVQQLS